jgi:two-component system, chemotaxis family, protein-glutamate methylesterase/glutaminase
MPLKGTGDIVTLNKIGKPSVYTCPECGGVLWQIDDPALLCFRCHTGHAYSARELLVDQATVKERELWEILHSLEEIEVLSNQLEKAIDERNEEVDVEDFRQIAQRAKANIEEFRRVLLKEKLAKASAIKQRSDKHKPDVG